MALRFDNGAKKLLLPYKIIIVDEYAKKLAFVEGLPLDVLELYKNPYLDYIENFWQPSLTNSDFRKQFYREPKIPIILYTPDPLTLRGEDKDLDLIKVKSLMTCCKLFQLTDVIFW